MAISDMIGSAAVTGLMLLATTTRADEPAVWPGEAWARATPAEAGLDESKLIPARDYALTGGGSGLIVRGGRVVLAWGDPDQKYDLKSTTKSFGATALGVAILDGKLTLTDRAVDRHPTFGRPPEENVATGWLDRVTLRHLATQTAGFAKPGGYEPLLFEPGTRWAYSDGGPNWLAECVTLAYRRDVRDVMFERVFTPIGIGEADLTWRKNSYRPREIDGIPRREFGSGISANVDAMARLGLLYLRGGVWDGRRLLPADFVALVGTTDPAVVGLPELDPATHGDASAHYGLLWWNNADGMLAGVPRGAFWSWGLHDSLIVVVPSLDLVVARAGQSWKRPSDGPYDVLRPFLEPIAAAATPGAEAGPTAMSPTVKADDLFERPRAGRAGRPRTLPAADGPPVPPSPVIAGIDWAPAASIVRRARGSDNWPLTWADDDGLYTAYGDGRGFEPPIDTKLSLGLARIDGPADGFTAVNLRSPTFERVGDGPKGPKASGLLMVDGVLYALVRNVDNAQLVRSADHGKTWTWSDWKFTEGFGCPTFLNYGRNYAGARDEYVYLYSHDNDGAYEPADRMVMARVPKDRLTDRGAYEVFAGLTPAGEPTWSRDFTDRAAAFTSPGRCYRSGISYDAGLRRYLWCQILPTAEPRFAGGFTIYDAPEPWGPWTTAFHAESWDVGPGESASLPPKWISADGRTVHLVFSGDDHFSVRRGTIRLVTPPR